MSKKNIRNMRRDRKIQEYLSSPSTKEFMRIIIKYHIKNSGINIEDIQRAKEMYRKAIPRLKGKIVRKNLVEYPERY